MTSTVKLKEAFEVESKHGAFYTGGNLEWIEDTIYCQTNANINVLNVETGLIDKVIGEQGAEEEDTIQTFTTDGNRTVTSHKSGLLKSWNQNGELEKMWKYIHKGPIARLTLKAEKLASGGCDGVVRIWDLQNQVCSLSLKGCQGVVNVVEFHPGEDVLFASGDDGKINSYELTKGEVKTIYAGHYSKVTGFVFARENYFVSCGRDKVIILWEVGKSEGIKVIPQFEAIETITGLPLKFKVPGFKSEADGIYVAAAGEKGVVCVWDVKKAKQVYVQDNSLVSKASEEGGLSVVLLRCNLKDKALAVVTTDHNIIIHHLKSFVCLKQFVGFSDDILDITFVGEEDSHLAIATNSSDIKLYCNATMNCQILKGHTDIVMSLATCPADPTNMLSSGKDNTVRLWKLDGNIMNCIATGFRHTGSVSSVAFSQTNCNFGVSVSQDMCLKLWEIPTKSKIASLNCMHTVLAHQKDINSVAVAPNDKIIATASQDKTAKLWTPTLELLGTLRGHKKSLWCVKFSPVDQVVVTASSDSTIKLWSIADLSCLKTLEGHDASVLKVHFLSSGMQILSAGGDGLVKLFSVKTSECTCTLDQHDAQVWAVAVKQDESGLVTGGGDSILIKWKDVTEELRLKKLQEIEELTLQEQKLSNYMMSGNYLKALKQALKLDKPFQVLKIVETIIKNGETGLADTIKELRNDQKDNLLKTAITWNTNSKHTHPAQLVINILLNEMQNDTFKPSGLRSALESALPYTERHLNRLTKLMQDLQFINYVVKCMKPHSDDVV
ncbi:transducin beta-like protein 3 [Diabrotica virgifera virgifera]|uniref:U3 small nucleolar RNA-associated protein 13 C-terminal domain-containing protein n=1 Tax=Diabrotica virgifera virgifera TaxID=50390 RepID=A0ABM5KSJ1_DIAVI|nr:transducin beta-like protein 3 [Diabrotica virgifera virgifera]